jgi:hypothetical protein
VALQVATEAAPTLALAEQAELWLAEGEQVTRIMCGQGRLRGIETHWLDAPETGALQALVRSLLGDGTGQGTGPGTGPGARSPWVMGYGLAATPEPALAVRRRTRAHRWPSPDFLPVRHRPAWWAWLGLLCGALMLALATDDWLAVQHARAEQQAQRERWQAVTQPRAAQHTASPVLQGTASGAQAVRQLLDHPWQAIFEAVERRAAPSVRWLRLEHETARGELRLQGVAGTHEAALASADELALAKGWREVLLMRVQGPSEVLATQPPVPSPAPGAGPVSFELRARVVAAVAGGLQ